MRFLMIGISIIIGVILVGVVFSVTMDLTQPREVEKIVEFEILTENDQEGLVTPGTYDKLVGIYNNYIETNLVVDMTLNYNDVDIDELFLIYTGYQFELTSTSDYIIIEPNDVWSYFSYNLSVGDHFQLIFLVEETQISSTSAILIALVPLLFATGVILYTYNTALRGREE